MARWAEECGFEHWSALVVILLVVVINNRNKE